MYQYLLVPIAVVCAGIKPVYRWPLNSLTCGFEVETSKSDALAPKQHECTITKDGSVVLQSETIVGSNGYVHFNPSQSYIDVPIKDCLEIESVGMMITLNPSVSDGTLVHYKANASSSEEFFEIRVLYYVGKIQTKMHINGEVIESNGISVSLNTWSVYGFSFNMAERKLYTFTKYSSNSKYRNGIGGRLGVPGILRFGSKQVAIPTDEYAGRMSCVLLYDKPITYDEALLSTNCQAEWENVPSPVPSCVTLPEPNQIWPLNMKDLGSEITNLRPPLNEPDYRFASGPGQLNNNAMKFDGSKYSTIQLGGIDPNYLSDSHAFGMFLLADRDNDASVLRAWTPASDAFSSVLKVVDTSVIVQLYDTSGQKCGELIVTGALIPFKWHVMAFQVDFPSDITIFVDEGQFTGTHTCGGPMSSISQYRLDVGYVDETVKAGFRGRMHCLVLLDDINNIEAILNGACNSSAIETVSKSVPSERNLLARLGKKNASPDIWMSPQESVNTGSLTQCGKRCLETPYCRSFTYDKEKSNCRLYDFVVFTTLVISSNTNYYILS